MRARKPILDAPLPEEVYQPLIARILRTFNFKAVKHCMDFCEWGWVGKGVP